MLNRLLWYLLAIASFSVAVTAIYSDTLDIVSRILIISSTGVASVVSCLMSTMRVR